MTVYIAHEEADRATAEALEKYLERRGHFVELEDGARGFGQAQRRDTVVVLWSKAAAASPQLEQRALSAMADDTLALVRLDRTSTPEPLRAAASIDAGARARREAAWAAVARAAQDAQARTPDGAEAANGTPLAPRPRRRRPVAGVMLAFLMVIAGAAFAWLQRDLLVKFRPDEAIAQALKAL